MWWFEHLSPFSFLDITHSSVLYYGLQEEVFYAHRNTTNQCDPAERADRIRESNCRSSLPQPRYIGIPPGVHPANKTNRIATAKENIALAAEFEGVDLEGWDEY